MNPDELKRFSLLVEFTEEDRDELLELLEEIRLAPGKSLFKEGDEADALFLVSSGQLRISSRQSGALGLLCEGAALGAISVVVVGKRQATAMAEGECEIQCLTRAAFRRLAEDSPRTACRLAEAVVAELASGVRANIARIADGVLGAS